MKGQTPVHETLSERKFIQFQPDPKLRYEGEVKNDQNKQPIFDGFGYLFNNETKCFYKGTFENGKKIQGIETFPNGDIYEGNY